MRTRQKWCARRTLPSIVSTMLTPSVNPHKLFALYWQVNTMQITVKKWGNSAAVRIPAFILAAAHVALDQTVEVREEQPVTRKADSP